MAGAGGSCRVRRESWELICVNLSFISAKGTKGIKGTKKSPQRAGGGTRGRRAWLGLGARVGLGVKAGV